MLLKVTIVEIAAAAEHDPDINIGLPARKRIPPNRQKLRQLRLLVSIQPLFIVTLSEAVAPFVFGALTKWYSGERQVVVY